MDPHPVSISAPASSAAAPSRFDLDAAWDAVARRDASWDGRCVFAVRSTGIYCRPSCPARRPQRSGVEFWQTPAAAEAAGYRACRRCRPAAAGPDPLTASLETARRHLCAHFDETVPLAALGKIAGLSPSHLQRAFKRRFGVSPRQYVERLRMAAVKDRLRSGDTVTRATYEAGFGAGSRLYEHAADHLGMTPGAYRRGGAGIELRYTIVDSVLGPLLVAVTERGLAAVMLGRDENGLEEALAAEYPRAGRHREASLEGWVAAVLATIEPDTTGTAPAPLAAAAELPLDFQGTAFETRVWQALREIPRGATRSYQQIAERLGKPTAARAVARACAANRLALVVPCHRVVRADGDSGGYRWGEDTKRRLLALEQGAAAPASGEPTRSRGKREG